RSGPVGRLPPRLVPDPSCPSRTPDQSTREPPRLARACAEPPARLSRFELLSRSPNLQRPVANEARCLPLRYHGRCRAPCQLRVRPPDQQPRNPPAASPEVLPRTHHNVLELR